MRLAVFLLAAAAAYGQTAPDPSEVLDSAREKIRKAMDRQPKYACLQTSDRTYYRPPATYSGGRSCDQMSADQKNRRKPLNLDAADRLRLEVAQGVDGEIHSWPGASSFDLTEIDQIVDSGPFGTGAFGGYLGGIFDNDAAEFDYRGEKTRGDKHVLQFGYTIAPEVSHYEIHFGHSWLTTGFSGTFEVDPATLEIGRVTVETSELPEETGFCEVTATLDYQRVAIGDGTFLLPKQSQLRFVLRDGEETDSTTVFSGCREFRGESAVRFDTPTVPPLPVPGAPGKPRPPLASRLGVDLRLTTPVDTDTSAAGDAIAATVVHAVHPYRSDEVLIPAGAVVHGRISRIEHHYHPSEYWLIGFAFESVEFDGQRSPIALRTELPAHYSGTVPVEALRQLWGRTPEPPPDSLEFPNGKRHVMAAGTVTHWITWTPAGTGR